jgi:hypothetical protein
LNEKDWAENFARPYRTALLILAAALLFFLRGERLFILGSLISYVALRTCFLAFLGELESRYLVPMLPSLELVLIAPTISRPSPTPVEDEITSRVDCVDQAAPETEAGRRWPSSHRDPQMGGEIATVPENRSGTYCGDALGAFLVVTLT